MAQTDLGIGLKCIKFLLVAFNLLFVLSGVLLVLTAVMVAHPMSQLTPLLDQHFLSPSVLLGAAGVAVIVVSCFGIWGAVRQSTALVTLFSMLLSLLLLLELGAGMSAFLLQDGLRKTLEDNIWAAMRRYDSDEPTRQAIDIMQSGLQCCGVNGPSDWQNVTDSGDQYPQSCCAFRFHPEDIDDIDTYQCLPDPSSGCLRALGLFVTRGSAFIASTAVVTAFTQFLGILFACTLGRSIRQQKTLRDLRRHQLRNNLINSYTPLDTKPMPPITITY